MSKIIGWIIRIVVVVLAFQLIIHIFQVLGFSDIFKFDFDKYEKEGGSVFMEGPDALDPKNDNEPIFGGGTSTKQN